MRFTDADADVNVDCVQILTVQAGTRIAGLRKELYNNKISDFSIFSLLFPLLLAAAVQVQIMYK
jgi:hypothetical protein